MTDQRTRMAPPGTPRWYDGEPKLPTKRIIKRAELHTALFLILIVTSAPAVEIDHA